MVFEEVEETLIHEHQGDFVSLSLEDQKIEATGIIRSGSLMVRILRVDHGCGLDIPVIENRSLLPVDGLSRDLRSGYALLLRYCHSAVVVSSKLF